MRKVFLFVIIVFCLTACDKKVDNDKSQEKPTQSVKDDISQEKPTQYVENNISKEKPTQSVENDTPQIKPTQPEEKEQLEVKPGITTPILIQNMLIGGLSGGTWMKPEEFYNSGRVNFDGFEYEAYLNDRSIGKAKGTQPANWMTGELLQGNRYDEEYSIVDLYDSNHQQISYGIALDADWELFPRPYTEQNTNKSEYLDIVTEYLRDYGIDNPNTSIKQVIKADLDGDGIEEMFIAADNTNDDQFDEVKSGDNAVLIFRKIVGEEVVDQIVEQDIRMEDENSWYRYLFRVETIADLDGDTMMEVIITGWYYEGIGWSIYKLRDNQLEYITGNGMGA